MAGLAGEERCSVLTIASHAGVNRVLIADALGLPASRLFRVGQDRASAKPGAFLWRYSVGAANEFLRTSPAQHEGSSCCRLMDS